jgi:hypothetical protein
VSEFMLILFFTIGGVQRQTTVATNFARLDGCENVGRTFVELVKPLDADFVCYKRVPKGVR